MSRHEAANRVVTRALQGQAVSDIAAAVSLSTTTVRELLEMGCEVGLLQSAEGGYALAVDPLSGDRLGPYRLQHRYVVDSTNRWAQTQDATALATVFAAEVQTDGRGRHNRRWASPAGGLWCTLAIKPHTPTRYRPRYTLAMAVALVEALAARDVSAAIKWPNDVLLQGSKLAGILTEYAAPWLRVGVGCNVAVSPGQLPAGAASLQGRDIDREAFAAAVFELFDTVTARPDRIVPRWRKHAATLGQQVRIETGTETVTGRAVGITSTGALRVDTAEGVQTITAGDCTHLRHS